MHLHEILKAELDKHFDGQSTNIVETGTIRGRGQAAEVGDGYSTQFFARHVLEHGGDVWAIDLNTGTVPLALTEQEMHHVNLREGHSITRLGELLADSFHYDYDVIFLDSDNDPQLVFHEFLLAEILVQSDGLIIVDDVRMDHHVTGSSALAKKGDVVWPYVKKHGYTWRIHERTGWADYKTGVLVIEPLIK